MNNRIVLYGILSENVTDPIDSPPMDLFNIFQLYNVLKKADPLQEYIMYIEPLGTINTNVYTDKYDKWIFDSDYIVFYYSSFFRKNGVKNQIIQNFINKISPRTGLYFADLYNGSSNYIEYRTDDLIKVYPRIDKVYRYSITPFLNKSMNEVYEGLPFIKDINIKLVTRYLRKAIEIDLIKDINDVKNIFPYKISSGCNFHCVFCSGKKEKYRIIGVNNIRDDLMFLKKHGVEEIIIIDQYPNLDMEYFSTFLDIVIGFCKRYRANAFK